MAYNSIKYKKSHFEKLSKIVFFWRNDEFWLCNIFKKIFELKKLISLFKFSLKYFHTSKNKLIEGIKTLGSFERQVLKRPSDKFSFTTFIKFFWWKRKLEKQELSATGKGRNIYNLKNNINIYI